MTNTAVTPQDEGTVTIDVETTPLTRKEIRAALLGVKHEAARIPLVLFDIPIELKQPSFAAVLDAREESSEKARIIDIIIQYAYVPGTDEQVFEAPDADTILAWPAGKDLLKLNEAIVELTGIDMSDAEEDLEKNPLEEQ